MAPKRRAVRKQSKKGEGRDSDTIDRLSDLPDDVLHRILSRIPIKDAVGTSLVSKRWQHLWRSIPKLEFWQWQFPKRSNLMKLVERALLLRGSFSVEEFTLSCDAKSDVVRINSWIESVVMRNVRNLHLHITPGRKRVVFPSCLFRCETLTRLRIGFPEPHDLVTPSSVCLPSLKDLYFTSVRFVDYGSVQNLLRSCPALEDLTIRDCHWMGLDVKPISAPNLQRLTIGGYEAHGAGVGCSCKVVINGPNVVVFDYSSDLDYAYRLVGSSSLNEAKLSLYNSWDLDSDSDSDLDSLSVGFCDQLQGLHNVRSLTLPAILFQSATGEDVFQGLPIFSNMAELKLASDHAFLGSKALATLLTKSPCLRILKIIQFEELDAEVSQALEPVPPCFESHLKKIIVDCPAPQARVNLDWIALLLKKASVLEEMVLYYSSKEGYNRLKRLKKLPRGSNHCKILLLDRSEAKLEI